MPKVWTESAGRSNRRRINEGRARTSGTSPPEGSRHEPQEVDAVDVYIVTIGVPAAAFRAHLVDVEGAQLVRELPPRRIVVALRSPADRQRLAALPGVEAVVPDRLEHPDQLA
jgi:hypothetical protein